MYFLQFYHPDNDFSEIAVICSKYMLHFCWRKIRHRFCENMLRAKIYHNIIFSIRKCYFLILIIIINKQAQTAEVARNMASLITMQKIYSFN